MVFTPPAAEVPRSDQVRFLGNRAFPRDRRLAQAYAGNVAGALKPAEKARLLQAIYEVDKPRSSRSVDGLIEAADRGAGSVRYARMLHLKWLRVQPLRAKPVHLLTAALADCDAVFVDVKTRGGERFLSISHETIRRRDEHVTKLKGFADEVLSAVDVQSIESVHVYTFQRAWAKVSPVGVRFRLPARTRDLLDPLVTSFGSVVAHRCAYDIECDKGRKDDGVVVAKLGPGVDAQPEIMAWGESLPVRPGLDFERPVMLLGVDTVMDPSIQLAEKSL